LWGGVRGGWIEILDGEEGGGIGIGIDGDGERDEDTEPEVAAEE
jgi:hypothetical protein